MKTIGKLLFLLCVSMALCVSCGDEPEITKKEENSSVIDGALRGVFSVSSTSKVRFSQGNLQYQASTNTWRFAEKQYDVIGSANKNISSSYNGWIDLFGWGTSGYNSKYPYMTSPNYSDYVEGENDIAGTNYDWGVYNAISNGGNTAGMWRTLTYDEWYYVMYERSNALSLVGLACVNGVNGMVLLPDNWVQLSGLNFKSGELNGGGEIEFETVNSYSMSEWSKMEANGAVFLPAAGGRIGSDVEDVGLCGVYWCSSTFDYDLADVMGFVNYYYYYYFADLSYFDRNFGLSVRIVQDVE